MNTETPIESGAGESLGLRRLNKADGLKLALALLDEVKEGKRNPLEVLERIKQHQAALNILTDKDPKNNKHYQIAEEFRQIYLSEAERNGKKFSFGNADFSIQEAGTKYHFDKCNDPVLQALYEQQAELKEKIQQREAYLKCIPPQGKEELVDGGEVVMIYPPYKTSTTTLFVTLK